MRRSAWIALLGLALWTLCVRAQPAAREGLRGLEGREALNDLQRVRPPKPGQLQTPRPTRVALDELLEQLRNPVRLPQADVSGLQPLDWRERLKQSQMPLPGATGTPASAAGTAAGAAAYQRWMQCRDSGLRVYEAGCQLKQGECPQLKRQYGADCFTAVDSAGFSLQGGQGVAAVSAPALERALAVLMADGAPQCTGVFLDPSHVLTAGHCRGAIEACRGQNQDCAVGFAGLGEDRKPRALARLMTDQYDESDPASDFDIWALDQPVAGVSVLPASKIAAPVAAAMRTPASIVGAVRFADCVSADDPACARLRLWRPADHTRCSIVCRLPSGALLHDCQTIGGLSGAPLLVSDRGKPAIAGLHTRFDSGFASAACAGESQVAVSMTRICAWIDEHHPELGGMCHEQ
ncbi:trypsin-like serine peptidase [Lysobacter enzymogenes]|uniref:trypsin-like serine peptidase n=1 Tax=Lysobacter enzymogenes TaxID=69 RepID=UPI00384A8C12